MEEDASFRNHVISYLTKLEVEIRALHLALEESEELPVSESQMTVFRALAASKSAKIGQQVRQEFGLQ
jgi:hypothetical protein